jgi:CheY-like chemotaxis protein
MTTPNQLRPIIIADDSVADRKLATTALKQAGVSNPVHEVKDGDELMDYLLRRGSYEKRPAVPEPGLILLDLNMPRKNGLEALEEVKSNIQLRHIPIVMLTTSKAEWDIVKSYALGVNSYITKPVNFDEFIRAMRALGDYWMELVSLPPSP